MNKIFRQDSAMQKRAMQKQAMQKHAIQKQAIQKQAMQKPVQSPQIVKFLIIPVSAGTAAAEK